MAGKKIIPFKYKHFADSAPEESRSEESASNNEGINESKQKSNFHYTEADTLKFIMILRLN